MMKIGGVNGTNNMQAGSTGMNMTADSVTKNIQNQIANAQKQLQELSSNGEMTIEEKMKKRQEIQQEITSLNQQLRQHQIDQRKEQQRANSSMDDMIGGIKNVTSSRTGNGSAGLSQASMQSLISADTSIKQAKVQGGMAAKMEGRAGVLESEIKMDAGRGTSAEKKAEELADIQQKVQAAAASQISTLAEANDTIKEAAKADQQSGKGNAKTESVNGKNSKETKTDVAAAQKTETVSAGIDGETTVTNEAAAAETAPQPVAYTSVDIYL